MRKQNTTGIETINHNLMTEYRMRNGNISISLLSYGASIGGIHFHNENSNIALTLGTIGDYQENPLYAGATLGPCAGRISNGNLPLSSGICHLSTNDGAHQLHGGFHGLSFRNWGLVSIQESAHACSVTLSCTLDDHVDGYSGNRQFTVCYTLTDCDLLSIHYVAHTDKPTYINLSNHTYFNLTGDFTQSALSQTLQINASTYTELGADHIPTRIASCKNTPFDFSKPRSLISQTKKYPRHPQLEIGRGYNHGFILNSPCDFSQAKVTAPAVDAMIPSLSLMEDETGRQLNIYTDAPCIVLYSGGFIGNDLPLDKGIMTSPSCALALECQDIPDTPNFNLGKMRVTTPEEPFERTIVYQFVSP